MTDLARAGKCGSPVGGRQLLSSPKPSRASMVPSARPPKPRPERVRKERRGKTEFILGEQVLPPSDGRLFWRVHRICPARAGISRPERGFVPVHFVWNVQRHRAFAHRNEKLVQPPDSLCEFFLCSVRNPKIRSTTHCDHEPLILGAWTPAPIKGHAVVCGAFGPTQEDFVPLFRRKTHRLPASNPLIGCAMIAVRMTAYPPAIRCENHRPICTWKERQTPSGILVRLHQEAPINLVSVVSATDDEVWFALGVPDHPENPREVVNREEHQHPEGPAYRFGQLAHVHFTES